jgi:DNA repair exonuclease SbcCD ATPase subunit
MRPVEAKRPFAEQISRLKHQISDFKEKSTALRTTVSRMTGAMTILEARKAAFREFNQDLNRLENRLDERFTNITAADCMVKLFRQTPDEIPAKLVRPSKTVSVERQKLLLENRRLTELALGQERCMLIQKMRLRLFHDHRDVCRLRRILNKLEGGGGDFGEDEDITEKLKSRIHNLRKAIGREQERISRLTNPQMERHDAATAIQKTWRGYWYRMRMREQGTARPSSPHEEQKEAARPEPRPGEAPAAAAVPEGSA